MALPAEKLYITPQEYLDAEENSLEKHEYFDGEIFLRSGGSANHSLIAGNTIREFGNAVKKKPCRVFTSDIRIHVMENGLYTYPDVTVVCGRPEYLIGRNDTITNPLIIVEVLSPSTKDYDRGGKFELYRGLSSLKEYILMDSERVYIEHFHKTEDGSWILHVYQDRAATFGLFAVDAALAIAEIYDKIEWSKPLNEPGEKHLAERLL